ncbi:3-phosphoglycerate kinase [Pseudomonas sp. 148P]|uniref:3-phosphoglycerate kinase n=1 Tax=Pseudomonas ulcerans TaxID=3115852 RepID=A0ABU7HTM9_9PSED|nr:MULTISPECIES: 3-phosphoglycerate kinase [unclassified Pseudomonas]MEE1923822.1 3-phosphoglycerate kinase [Pseudomonas sp. 147P]MEE1934900.1 3-phosphoglycerate kinase [Pseudomonas sp. 148P]
MKKFCVALLVLLPLPALAAYPIEVEKKLETGVKLDTTTYDTANDMTTITLNNYGDSAASCRVTFRNGPETPRVRRVEVPAGKSLDVNASFNKQIIKMRIAVDCKGQQAN